VVLLWPLPTKRGVQLIGYVILPVADDIFSQFHVEIWIRFATEAILRLQVDACDKEILHRLPGLTRVFRFAESYDKLHRKVPQKGREFRIVSEPFGSLF